MAWAIKPRRRVEGVVLLGEFGHDEYRSPWHVPSGESKDSPHFKSFVCGDFHDTPAGRTNATVEVSRIEKPAVGRGGRAGEVCIR